MKMSKSMTATQKAIKPEIMTKIHEMLNHTSDSPSYAKQYAQNTKENQLQIKLHGLAVAKLSIDSLKAIRDFAKQHNGMRTIENGILSFVLDIA